jgi:hypothetical protein
MRTWIALISALFSTLSLAILSRTPNPPIIPYVLVLSFGCAAVSFALWRAEPLSKKLVIGVALLLHGITLAGVPAFEDDYYRFIWDGWQLLASGTPYGKPPADFFLTADIPLALKGILDGINNPDVPTIYGPFLEMLFGLVYLLIGPEALGVRMLFAAANIALIWLMLRQHRPAHVALYAWNPLIMCECVLHAHPDGIMALALFGALTVLARRPMLGGLLFALAAGTKLVALAAWPLLLRVRPIALITAILTLGGLYAVFLAQGYGAGFEATQTFATRWHFNPLIYQLMLAIVPSEIARLMAFGIAAVVIILLHAQTRSVAEAPLALIFGIILLFAAAINSWYLIWILPFALSKRHIWPFAATVALPFSYLTGYNLGDGALDIFEVNPIARLIEAAILLTALVWDGYRWYSSGKTPSLTKPPSPPLSAPRTAIIIPAYNEELSVGGVITALRGADIPGLVTILLVDNGSSDATATCAKAAGAVVIHEPERGYGAACLAGIHHLAADITIVLFADADGADIPADAAQLVRVIIEGDVDMAVGSRMLGTIEPGAMTWPQRFGNWLAPALMRLIWGVQFTDLGPLRAIRRTALDRLHMTDRDFGWTVEMQVRAAKLRLRTCEVPVGYRKRIGVSKISGTVSGVVRAGTKILYVVAREAFGDFGTGSERSNDGYCSNKT